MRTVLFRGAGDLVSGSIRRVHLAGMRVVCTEIEEPLCVRRLVSYAEAVYEGAIEVEGVMAVRSGVERIEDVWEQGRVPVVVDPDLAILEHRSFDVLVDGTMAKRNLGTRIDMAPAVIALGPGFVAGRDCHAVVETLEGHDLGRVITRGGAAPDTGVPGPVGGAGGDVIVLRAPRDGIFEARARIGDMVERGQVLGCVGDEEVRAGIGGLVRGLIRDGRSVVKGLKIGDVDPVADPLRARTISAKSNAVAGGVLEAISRLGGC
jgi:xanthine dehydrogenase accessory factor